MDFQKYEMLLNNKKIDIKSYLYTVNFNLESTHIGSYPSARWAQDFTSQGKDPCLDLWAKDFTS